MNDKQKKRIEELEIEYADFLANLNTINEKIEKCHDVILTIIYYRNSDENYWSFCKKNFSKINELYNLYLKSIYDPVEDEKTLSYLFIEGMNKEEKLHALDKAHWTVCNSGYCDAMANKIAAGKDDSETKRWQKNCDNIFIIDRYYQWLVEQE